MLDAQFRVGWGVRLDDGEEMEFRPGNFIPPGHDG